MSCQLFRDLISADLDDELSNPERAVLAAHLETCAACAEYQQQAIELSRSLRIGPADQIPDLTARIMAGAPDRVPDGGRVRTGESALRRATRRRPHHDIRWALGFVGLVQIAIALPAFFGTTGALHLGHSGPHSGGWDAAFGLGLLVVAVQPWRARGLLPMVLAVTVVMVGTRVVDAVSGRAGSMPEVSHLLEVCSLAMVWLLARGHTPPRERRSTPVPDRSPSELGAGGLRIVHPFASLRHPLVVRAREDDERERRAA